MLPLNFIAIVIAAVAAFVIGALWHSVFFSKQWHSLAEIKEPTEEEKKAMTRYVWKPLLTSFITNLVMAFCLANIIFVNTAYFNNAGSITAGLGAGFWVWLGFMAMNTLSPVIWENRSIRYWAFGNAYTLTLMLTMGGIIAYLQ